MTVPPRRRRRRMMSSASADLDQMDQIDQMDKMTDAAAAALGDEADTGHDERGVSTRPADLVDDGVVSVEILVKRATSKQNADGTYWVGGGGALLENGHRIRKKSGMYEEYNFTLTVDDKANIPVRDEIWHFEGTKGKSFNGIDSIAATNARPMIYSHNMDGVVRWLCDNVKGIGQQTARKIISKFGANAEKYLGDPAELGKIEALNETQVNEIAEKWNTGKGFAKIDVFLRGFKNAKGVTLFNVNQRKEVAKRFGDINELKKVLAKNPYDLMRIKGLTFRVLDGYVIKENIVDLKGPERIRAALEQSFQEHIESRGHTIGFYEDVQNGVKKLLEESARSYGRPILIPKEAIAAELDLIKNGGPENSNPDAMQGLVWNSVSNGFQRRDTFADELLITTKTLDMIKRGPRMSRDEAKALTDRAIQRMRTDFRLDPSQEEAVITALRWPISIITGGPGTGKSTVMKVFKSALELADLGDGKEISVLGSSFTGKASDRLRETAGIQSETIHRRLGARGLDDFTFNAEQPLVAEGESPIHLVIDEDSMTDTNLKARLFDAISDGVSITLVGDVAQLPSVGPGQTFRDMIESGMIPVMELQRGHRQNQFSGIPEVARRFQYGEAPFTEKDFQPSEGQQPTVLHNVDHMGTKFSIPGLPGVFWIDPDKMPDNNGRFKRDLPDNEKPHHIMNITRDIVSLLALQRIDQEDVLVITPQRKNNGSDALNEIIRPQRVLDASRDNALVPQIPIRGFPDGLRVGDMVMQGNNHQGLANGQSGVVVDFAMTVHENGQQQRVPVIDFSGERVLYDMEKVANGNLMANYANTVHKYQGSEAPVVLIVIPDEARRMATLENAYTALTRAKLQVYFIASKKAIDSILTKDNERRNTGLCSLLNKAKAKFLKEMTGEKNPMLDDCIGYMERNEEILERRRRMEETRRANVELRKKEMDRSSGRSFQPERIGMRRRMRPALGVSRSPGRTEAPASAQSGPEM